MRYFGGKARISKPLAEFLNGELEEGQPFVDAFCGSCNVISKIDPNRVRIANDKHEYLIAMWEALQNGWVPPEHVSKEDYYYVKNNPDDDKALTGFVGFGCSFAGKWWGGYAFDKSQGKNYAAMAKRSCAKKIISMTDVGFQTVDFKDILLPEKSMVYCDIPYKGTTGYTTGGFNHPDFYDWCKELERHGHKVYVSEYRSNIPCGASVVWGRDSIKKIRDKNNHSAMTEEVVFRFL